MSTPKTPKDVLELMEKEGVEVVDLRFMDFPGLWQHFSVPPREVDNDTFEGGLGFDGSSIRGWQAINESDMLVKPVPETAFIDPFFAAKTLVMICNICDPVTGEDYTRDPRNIARKAVNFLKGTGIADIAYFGPEAEFFIFDDIRFDQNEHEGYYHIDSVEGRWNTGRVENPNLGYKPRYKEGYFPVPPTDSLQDIRSEMMLTLESIGIPVEAQHHEVATAGQGNRYALRSPGGDGRQPAEIQICHQKHRQEIQQDGYLHAQTLIQRQRYRHARSSLPLEGRSEPFRW